MHQLKLVSIGNIIVGGTTKPVNIIALEEDENHSRYIMKVFKEKYILQNASVAKEIICSELAKEFDLVCPEYGIINVEHDDLINLYDEEILKSLDTGYKFCSKFIDQAVIFNPNTTNSFLKDYEFANVFAFDVLIHNVDRGGPHNKPNMLITDTELILIDHELTFPFINNTSQEIDYELYLRIYRYDRHVLIKNLKSLRNKEGVFDDFIEMLKHLNINKLSIIFDKMNKFNIPFIERQKFMSYFAWAKNNPDIFERYLKAMLK
ncbi:HipA family kinase [uncultured Flavobacterium sp.]|uniref:HipA family kinase n=1 Tax=uncultured Flavobacterium sp. TaxID=165435 RepID=UPI0030C87465